MEWILGAWLVRRACLVSASDVKTRGVTVLGSRVVAPGPVAGAISLVWTAEVSAEIGVLEASTGCVAVFSAPMPLVSRLDWSLSLGSVRGNGMSPVVAAAIIVDASGFAPVFRSSESLAECD